MEITCRLATKEDQDFLWEMLYQAVYVAPGEAAPSREIVRLPELAKYVQDWGNRNDLGMIAEDENGMPLGAAWLRLFKGEKRGYGYVADDIPEVSVAVLPEYRGQGIGARLLEELLRMARARWRGVSLSVQEQNPAARLYLRLGFVEVNRQGDSLTMLLKNQPG